MKTLDIAISNVMHISDKAGGITPPSTMASLEETVEVAQDGLYDSLLSDSSDEEREEEDWGWKQEKAAEESFNKGSMAIEKGRFVDAKKHFREALETRLGFLPSTCRSYSNAWLMQLL